MPEKTTILCVAPFNNPHIVPIYDEMAAQNGVDVTRASVNPLTRDRVELGWPEMPAESPYLQPWRRARDRWLYFTSLLRSDVVVLPGFFHFRTLPFHNWLRRLTGKVLVLWSEPFLNHPRTSHSRLSLTVRKALLAPCDSPLVNLLAIGKDAEKDYFALGARRWKTWVFGFSARPMGQLERDPHLKVAGPVQLVYSGALIPRKGVDVLISALGRPELVGRDWRLTVLGDGSCRDELQAQTERLGIADKVTFTGALPIERCVEVYEAGDILVLPSRFDGWGAVVNEAMEFGMAIIASDRVGATRPLVAEGINGLLFHNESAVDLAGCLHRLFEDRDLLARMRRSSRDRIDMFRPAEAAKRLVALCRGLAGHAPMPHYGEGYCSPLPVPSTVKA